MLEGFEYELNPKGPDGTEWQSPQRLSLNKEQPRATFYPFASAEQSLGILPDNAAFYRSLDGPDWQFRWVGNPWERDSTFQTPGFDASSWDRIAVPGSWNIQGLQPDGTQKYGTPIYVNQPVIFITIAGLLATGKRGRDAHPSRKLVDIQKPQRGGLVSAPLHRARIMGWPRDIYRV